MGGSLLDEIMGDRRRPVESELRRAVGEARTIVALFQRRWYVELLIWEMKSGLGMGQHQVTKSVERVERSIAISVLAYLMLIKLQAQDIPQEGAWSLFQLKQDFAWKAAQEQVERSARKIAKNWLRKRKTL